jgi:D-alanyl-D-alanine carboxypeptidase
MRNGKRQASSKLPFAVKSTSDSSNALVDHLTQTWNIQLGAFPNKQAAQAKLTSIRGSTVAALEGKPAYTVAVQKGGNVLYRARFGGFDEASAKQACARIAKLGNKCITVSPQS